MNPFESLMEKSTLMMEAYKDFVDLCAELKNERSLGSSAWEGGDSEYAEGSPAEEAADRLELASDPYCNAEDEFPEQQFFSMKDIDPNDPDFWTGKSLGIPVAVVVRDNEGQDKLLPIINGKFTSRGL